MTTTAKQLGQVALGSSTGTIYGPVTAKAIVAEILVCNTDTTDRTVTIYAGSGTAVANTIVCGASVAAGETKVLSLSTVLDAGHYLKGLASAAAVVSVTASGVEVT